MIIENSADIDVFDFRTIYDLSGATGKVRLINLSSGPGLANVTYWFVVTTPSNIPFHQATVSTPDIVGLWNTEHVLPTDIPVIQGHIDWSGYSYTITGYVKDASGAIYKTAPYSTQIKRPSGNKDNQRNNFGNGMMSVLMNCCNGKLVMRDLTSYSYMGQAGYRVSKTLKLVFPPDDTSTTPNPFQLANFNEAEVSIPYNGKNYQVLLDAVYDYEQADNTVVRIKYKFKACFDINCGTDLCSIICAFQKFQATMDSEGCSKEDMELERKIMNKLMQAVIGLMQPLCGINVSKLVAEMRELLGGCVDCDEAGGGINPTTNCAVPVNLEIESGS